MSVTVRPYRRGGWEVDILWRTWDGRRQRERKRVSGPKSAARRWGEERERELLVHGPPEITREVPTLNTFWPRFLDGHARANRQKPSGIAAKDTIGRVHLLPLLGARKLDAITTEDIQRLKAMLRDKSAKTVNNVLTVLNVLLKKAAEWDVIERMPCVIRLLPTPKSSAAFHDFDDYERLVESARSSPVNAYLCVLLAGEAGLRCGEVMALRWTDVDLRKRQLCVQQSDWKGHVTAPKGNRLRYVPMTTRLASALQGHRHLRGERVLCQDDGSPLTQKIVRELVRRAARRAGVAKGVCTSCGTRSVRTWRCGARQLARFRSWRGIRTCRRRSGTCTSVPRRSKTPSDSWSRRVSSQAWRHCGDGAGVDRQLLAGQ